MAQFLVTASYTPHAWAALVKKPEDEEAKIRHVVEKAGGKLVSLFFTLGGDQHIVGIVEAPNAHVAAALTAAILAADRFANATLTAVFSGHEMVAVLQSAASLPAA